MEVLEQGQENSAILMSSSPGKNLSCDISHLTEEQQFVCCGGGTERPFTGKYWDCKVEGTYNCVACGVSLFSSEAKYDSGSGWPSFCEAIDSESVTKRTDTSHGMIQKRPLAPTADRTSVTCSRTVRLQQVFVTASILLR